MLRDPLVRDGSPQPRAPAPQRNRALNVALTEINGPDIDVALRLARDVGPHVPVPARGRTLERWRFLSAAAERDLSTARLLEAHLDALAILAESGAQVPLDLSDSTWGVFAAEAPGVQLRAHLTADGWVLTGTKPWCSLANRLSHALVTATVDHGRRLFAVDLSHAGVHVLDRPWVSRGLVEVPSGPIELDDVPAVAVGGVDWYLDRPGFWHGAIGVAACWYGGARAVARTAARRTGARDPDQIALWHLGALDLDLHTCAVLLTDAAAVLDRGAATGDAGQRLALRVRSGIALAAERILTRVGHASGPGPLTGDPTHARRVADLTVYLRQHHAERDEAALGALVDGAPW